MTYTFCRVSFPLAAGSSTTVVITQPMRVGGPAISPHPYSTKCPSCHADVVTTTKKQCGEFVWIVAGIICLVG